MFEATELGSAGRAGLEFLRLPPNLTGFLLGCVSAVYSVLGTGPSRRSCSMLHRKVWAPLQPSCFHPVVVGDFVNVQLCWDVEPVGRSKLIRSYKASLELCSFVWGRASAMMTLLPSNIKNRSRLLLRRKQCSLLFVCTRPNRTLVRTHIVYVLKLAFLQY